VRLYEFGRLVGPRPGHPVQGAAVLLHDAFPRSYQLPRGLVGVHALPPRIRYVVVRGGLRRDISPARLVRICLICLQGVRGLEADLAGFRVQVLYLQEHHALLRLRLSPQLLHLDVYVAVDLLEEEDILRVEIGRRLQLLEGRRGVDLGALAEGVGQLEVLQAGRRGGDSM
jgi:hypothetical protein